QRRQAVDPAQAQRIDLVQGPEFAVGIPPAMGQFGELGQLGRVGIDVRVHTHRLSNEKTAPERGFPVVQFRRNYWARVPTTSTSTRRFFARPSRVVLSATGWPSPLPSV